jgi:hypothetical protein
MIVAYISHIVVEYTPQAYIQSDLNLFFNSYSPAQVGTSPVLASIDGGKLHKSHCLLYV